VSGLELATLQRLRGLNRQGTNGKAVPTTDGHAVPVQFNPASLKISRRNNVDRGGVTASTQKRQHPSQENSTLSFELEFDTAEQGSGEQYVDVRRWTALIRQFVEPPPDRPGDPPPAVRFAWGTLRYDGIIEEVTEDLDYFAPDGTPLHAKVGVSIKEQDFQYESNAQGPGKRDARRAADPGGTATTSPGAGSGQGPPPGTAPGSSGTRQPERVVQAQAGESVQELLAREGLDPAAWRAAMQDLDNPLALAAGASIQIGAEISAGVGIGLSAGFASGSAPGSAAALAGALGLDAAALALVQAGGGGGAGASGFGGAGAGIAGATAEADPREAGFALAAAGGVHAAAAVVATAAATQAANRARGSFAVSGPPVGGPAARGSHRPTAPRAAAADPRALGYGRSIPLRPRPGPVPDSTLDDQQRPGDGGRRILPQRRGGGCR
jgi:Contractile injection system tube protein